MLNVVPRMPLEHGCTGTVATEVLQEGNLVGMPPRSCADMAACLTAIMHISCLYSS